MDRLPVPSSPRLSRRALLRAAGALGTAGLLGTGAAGASTISGGLRTVAAEPVAFARVWARTPRQAAALAAFDDTHALFTDGSLELLLWPGDRRKLDALGVDYELTPATPQRLTAGTRAPGLAGQPGERTEYRRLADFVADMAALAAAHPQQARLVTLAEPSLEGRPVYALELADDVAGAERDGRPTVVIDGVHHAREWPSAELPLMFAYDLLENYEKEARTTAVLQGARVLIVPIVNPDGFNQSREAPTDTDPAQQLAYWRKNKRSYTDALYGAGATHSYANADAHGTDPNRNYPFYWGGEGGNSDPRSQTYAGKAPFAEPESRNIARMMKGVQATAYLTNHTYGRLVMRPWGYTTEPSPDNALQTELGARMTAVNGYKNIIGLQLYPTAGTSRDWSYAALRTIVYTFEHGTRFHAAYSSTVPKMYADNRVPFLLLAEAGIDAENHGVITGTLVDASGAPVTGEVRLHKAFETKTAGGQGVGEVVETVADTRTDGTFEVHANPSTRPTLLMDGSARETWMVRVSGAGAQSTADVFLDRGTRVDLGTITLA